MCFHAQMHKKGGGAPARGGGTPLCPPHSAPSHQLPHPATPLPPSTHSHTHSLTHLPQWGLASVDGRGREWSGPLVDPHPHGGGHAHVPHTGCCPGLLAGRLPRLLLPRPAGWLAACPGLLLTRSAAQVATMGWHVLSVCGREGLGCGGNPQWPHHTAPAHQLPHPLTFPMGRGGALYKPWGEWVGSLGGPPPTTPTKQLMDLRSTHPPTHHPSACTPTPGQPPPSEGLWVCGVRV